MVYFHVDRSQRRVQDLGFDSVRSEQQKVYVGCDPVLREDPWMDDQSYYYPYYDSGVISLGLGGVDDGPLRRPEGGPLGAGHLRRGRTGAGNTVLGCAGASNPAGYLHVLWGHRVLVFALRLGLPHRLHQPRR